MTDRLCIDWISFADETVTADILAICRDLPNVDRPFADREKLIQKSTHFKNDQYGSHISDAANRIVNLVAQVRRG